MGRSDILKLLREQVGDRAKELEEEENPRADVEYDYPDFSERGRNPAYAEAVQELADICGDKPIEFGDLEGGFYINVRTNKHKDLDVEAVQNQFLAGILYVCFESQSLRSHHLLVGLRASLSQIIHRIDGSAILSYFKV
ncbi:MAG: hypothetical protein J7524_00300 [Roseofilum sp. Belize BBD 4]|uniref:hypothetical protein n=1 Tax=Roseofilum sp. Belize BBD 4 TaxID=2821500 RepID=UPI001B26AF54|nr:hypothetical protein [Roseofilum sp. Belize BBD 4]MBP0031590.1 hypothetical protein [Roseofilum sp. Belize BBD 4]